MPLPTWDQLEKNQTDAEKIETAISRLIAAHNDDANAHIGAGRSLNSHKASAIIDHIAKSIVYDKLEEGSVDWTKLVFDQFLLATCFESIDGWNTFGDAGYATSNKIFEARIDCDNDINDSLLFYTQSPTAQYPTDFAKDSFIQSSIRTTFATNQIIYFVTGDFDTEAYGFKISNGNLYALHVHLGVEYTTQITGITVTNYNVLRAILDKTNDKIYFYANGTLKTTHDSNLPSGSNKHTIEYYVETLTANVRSLIIRELFYSQKR